MGPKFIFITSYRISLIDKKIIIPLAAIAVIAIVSGSSLEPGEKSDVVFHATLAEPDLYRNGVYSDRFTLEGGEYVFRFVPNGSSPTILSITLTGDGFEFYEEFMLEGTLQETGISEYFTWDYGGQKTVLVPNEGEVTIVIDPNGDVNGAVSVDMLKI